jgi:hypothetical protein
MLSITTTMTIAASIAATLCGHINTVAILARIIADTAGMGT